MSQNFDSAEQMLLCYEEGFWSCKTQVQMLSSQRIKGGVGGECESCTMYPIGSHMAGPITLKLSGIDRGNSVSVLGRVRGRMIQDS